MLRLHVLATGSKGNCSVVENTTTGAMLLIDCGICRRDFLNRCADAGANPLNIVAAAVTHEHTDHTKGLDVVLRWLAKNGRRIPVFATQGTIQASSDLGKLAEHGIQLVEVCAGDRLCGEDFSIFTFPTSHDAADSIGLRIDEPGGDEDSLGFMTDTGIVTPEAAAALARCRLLAIEANHDVGMLRNGPYAPWLKERVGSNVGHLSNDQTTDIVRQLSWDGLEHVIGMHGSETNNLPRLGLAAVQAGLDRASCSAVAHVGLQHQAVSIG